MSQRQNYRKQYFNHSQDVFSDENLNLGLPIAGYTQHQPFLYPNHSYSYGMQMIPQNSYYSPTNHQWHNQSLVYDYHSSVPPLAHHGIINPIPNVQIPSVFSPEAPEFISKQAALTPTTDTQMSCSSLHVPKRKKPKKKKKKVTPPESTQSTDSCEIHSDVNPKRSGLLNYDEAKEKIMEQKPNHAVKVKAVRFEEPFASRPEALHKDDDKTVPRSAPIPRAQEKRAAWPELLSSSSKKTDLAPQQPRMSFADKLKTPAMRPQNSKSPFLDWRDQRTNNIPLAENVTPSRTFASSHSKEIIKREVAPMHEKLPPEDGFVTVSRKKSKDKKQNVEDSNQVSQLSPSLQDASPKAEGNDEKKKLEKQRKRLREKEKKKRVREEKILAEKLAPKGQKVTFITTKVMEKFLTSGRPTVSTNKPVIQLKDEMFPALGRPSSGIASGNVSESESEWETTEVEVVPKQQASLQRTNVKRTDPIQFDLMALITKKTTKKKTLFDNKRTKSRPGIVANVLDRSAPTLSRGKIRNKKRKLSEIRKALLAAKAKKKIAQELKLASTSTLSSGTRPHLLHSKKFREYCDQMLTDEIDVLSRDMLYHLRTFQDRVYKKDPIKARMKKRLVAGLREVTKQVERNRIKIIFLAPDIQRCPETGGLDEAVRRLLDTARKMDIPIVYALSRRKIGRVLLKKVPVSCCGILNFQATEETWKKLTEAVTAAREHYQLKLQELGLKCDSENKQIDDPLKDENVQEPNEGIPKKSNQTDVLLDLVKLSLKD